MGYQDVKDKLYHGHRKVANNTYLLLTPIVDEGSTTEAILLILHSSTVAAFYPTHLELFSTHWHTRTTMNRLNLALELAGIHRHVFQGEYHWYIGGMIGKPFYDGIQLDYSGGIK